MRRLRSVDLFAPLDDAAVERVAAAGRIDSCTFTGMEYQGVLKLGAMVITETILLFLGLKFAFIGIGTIVVFSIIGLAVVVISFRRSAVGG